MGQLTDMVTADTEQKQVIGAGQLINTVTALKAQYVSTNSDITALKVKIKADVAGNVWNGEDIELLGKKLQLLSGIKTKGQNYKTQLGIIRDILADPTYKAELQTEIDGLNIPA